MPLGAFRINSLAKVQAVAAPRTAATATTTGTYAVSTSSPKYGTGKGATGATASSQLQIDMNGTANMDDFFDNTKSITIEFWWQVTSTSSQLPGIISHLNYPSNIGGWWIRTRYDRSVGSQRIPELVYYTGSSYSVQTLFGWGVPTVNTWYHVAFENHNGKQNIWIDGTNVMSRTTPTNYATNTTYDLVVAETWLGRTGYSTQQESIDELRVSQTARYQVDGTSITVPTGAFTNDSTTKCLFHCDGTNGSTTFTDDVS